MGFGSEIKSFAAGAKPAVVMYGRYQAIVGAVVGTLIAICMIIGSVFLIKAKSERTATSTATVVTGSAPCTSSTVNNNLVWSCSSLKISYIANGKPLSAIVGINSSENYTVGRTLTVYYDPNNASDVSASSDINTKHTIGWVLIPIAILILVGSWAWLYITIRNSDMAAIGGVEGIVGAFRR
jgi:hypothetical protein